MTIFSEIPSVDSFLRNPYITQLIGIYGRDLTVSVIRSIQSDLRYTLKDNGVMPDYEKMLEMISKKLEAQLKPSLVPVINATGVILHTNLGRAPISQAAFQALSEVASGYSTLEYDLERGKRGSRYVHAEDLLKQLTGCEAAFAVNNNAGAVLLILAALANRRKVIISRSQLVEIGGGFRIPDVMRQSGAKLVEVGTTNRTHLSDYENALKEGAALVLVAHQSNFRLEGFYSEPTHAEVVLLAHRYNIPVIQDLGSGAFLNTEDYGLAHEITIQDSMEAGFDLVCFSGDKLLGGPQAGIILGKKALVDKVRKHPLARALRTDKLCLAALNATLIHYLKGQAENQIPLYQMLSRSLDYLQEHVQGWIDTIGIGKIIHGKSTTGGGSLPEEEMDTWLLALSVRKPEKFLSTLRDQNPPIIARIFDDQVVFDPRTILPEQEQAFLSSLKAAIIETKENK